MKILGFGVLTFIFLTILTNSIAFFFNGSISPVWIVLSFVLSLTFTYILSKRSGAKRPYLWVVGVVAIVAASLFVGNVTMDVSYDGNTYHKYAIGELSDGWNPIYEEVDGTYSNTYPKASWIFAASVYQITGNIEAGKSMNVLIVILTFLFAFAYLRTRLNVNRSIALAFLLALGPVIAMQLFSNYVDGMLGGLLISLTIIFNALVDKKVKIKPLYLYIAIIMLIVIIGNLKFTGLVYAGVVAVAYLLFIMIRRDWKTTKWLIISGIVSLALAIGVVGASTYIKNTALHGHPLYPLMGEGAVDIMTANQPPTYADKNRIHKFLESNLGETDSIGSFWGWTENKLDSELKVPFTFNIYELELLASGSPDIRQAGYGVWFGGILLLSLGSLIYLFVKNRRRLNNPDLYLALLPVLPVVVTILLLEESWWARYIPQLILFPVVVLTLLYLNKVRVLPHILLFTLLFNTLLLFSLSASHQYNTTSAIRHNIETLIPCTGKGPQDVFVTDVHGAEFLGSTYNLRDWCGSLKFNYMESRELNDSYTEVWNGIYSKIE